MENSLSNINSNSNSWKIALAIAIPIAIVPKKAIAIALSILLLMSDSRICQELQCPMQVGLSRTGSLVNISGTSIGDYSTYKCSKGGVIYQKGNIKHVTYKWLENMAVNISGFGKPRKSVKLVCMKSGWIIPEFNSQIQRGCTPGQ